MSQGENIFSREISLGTRVLHRRDRFGTAIAETMIDLNYELGFWIMWVLVMALGMICIGCLLQEYILWRKYKIDSGNQLRVDPCNQILMTDV